MQRRAEAPVGPAFVHLLAEFERVRNRHWMHWDSIDQSASGQAILEARAALAAAQEKSMQPADERQEGWKEAAIAWEVCASLHREYCKGKDPFYKTRQSDFQKHADAARAAITNLKEDNV